MIVYATIAVIGLLLLGGLTFLGGDADADIAADLDSDADGGHHWLSLKVWAVFAMGFGAAGAIVRAYGGPTWAALLCGLIAGVLMGFLAAKLIDLLHRQEGTSSYELADLQGKTATVSLPILEGKAGEVRALVGGTQISRSARSHDGAPIAQGTQVEILQVGPPFIVRPTQPKSNG